MSFVFSYGFRYHSFLLLPQAPKARLPWAARERQSAAYLPIKKRFVLPPNVPLPLLLTAAVPRWGIVAGGGATGVAYVMLMVQVAAGASVAPQVVPVKLNNVFAIPVTDSAVIVTGVLVARPLFLIVTTLVTEVLPAGIVKVKAAAPPAFPSVPLVAAVKANGPAATPVPERLTGVPVPVAGPPMTVAV